MAQSKGWHKSDIKAALEKRGLSLSNLDQTNGFPPGTCSAALYRPHRRAELVIAEALGRSPRELWPSRYHDDGSRLCPQPTENYRALIGVGHRQKSEAA